MPPGLFDAAVNPPASGPPADSPLSNLPGISGPPQDTPNANAAMDRTNQTVQSIEHNLGQPGKQDLSQLDDNVRHQIYDALDNLRKTDANFKDDLTLVNARLQHDGYLPNLYLIDNEKSATVDPSKLVGPNSEDGFHFQEFAAPPAPEGGSIDTSPPAHDAPPGMSQPEWHEATPGNPVGSNGENGNVGGDTPIGSTDVQSNAVNTGKFDDTSLDEPIMEALKILNAQRAAEGLPPIDASPENLKAIKKIIHYESGGNPNAQNNSDSNAAKGDPSRGLMQTIGSTFSSYHVKGTSNNIFDPVANIAAGVNYAMSRYGSLQNVPGVKLPDDQYVGY